MTRLLSALVGLLLVGMTTQQAFAQHGEVGYIEICKAANPALTGTFRFRISDASGGTVVERDVGLGTCTPPIQVEAGDATVDELGGQGKDGNGNPSVQRDFLLATADAVGHLGPVGLVKVGNFAYRVQVPRSPNDKQNVVTITYYDQLVTGVVEVCKEIVPGSGLVGVWSFSITGAMGFQKTVTVPIGACSLPVTVPAGKVVVQETDAFGAVIGIGSNPPALSADYASAKVVVPVLAGDGSQQTLVTMVNNSVRLKLCKYVDQGLTNVGPYPFTFSATGAPGPSGPIAPLNLPGGIGESNAICTVVGTYRAGTRVVIAEGIVPGTKVGSITVDPPNREVGLSLADRMVTVELGPGETVVTYGDIPALDGLLKVCKVADPSPPPIPPDAVFTFTVTDGGSVQNVAVPVGSCAKVLRYPFNTTLSVVEGAMPNVRVLSIGAVPPSVKVIVGGVPTNTGQAVLTDVDLAGRSASVTIGENNITELTFINVDPPPAGTVGARTSTSSAVAPVTSRVPTARGGTSSVGAGGTRNATPSTRAGVWNRDLQKANSEALKNLAEFRRVQANLALAALRRK